MTTKPEVRTAKILNFLDVARWISEQEGYHAASDLNSWIKALMSALEIRSNDCHIRFTFMEDDEYDEFFDLDDIICQFHVGLQKHYGFKNGEDVLLHISW